MPKTQLKAIGSLADRIATLSPGDTPQPAREAATRDDSSTTSAYDIEAPSIVRHGSSGPSEAPLSR